MTTKRHYDTLLAPIYAWMVGDFQRKQQETEQYFRAHHIQPQATGLALDLGAGHGLQSISLARLRFHVLAIDFNAQLLDELRERAEGLAIKTCQADLTRFRDYLGDEAPEVIVCMGDTLTHLEDLHQLTLLLSDCQASVVPGGKLLLSFRALTHELTDTQRFIPVRSDANRIHTCVLEYFPDRVRVTDLLHERQGQEWVQKASSYYKLRISEVQLKEMLLKAGWQLADVETINGMTHVVAMKPVN